MLKLFHDVDAAHDPVEARERLRLRLSVIDGGGGWGWPDDRSPYPGLRAFDLGEHRVFFGRAREITQIAERLRSPERATPAILTVVGPSGCGKSSLIRAGVLPRIAGENYWVPLPPFLPGVDPLGSLTRAMATVIGERHLPFDVTSLRKDLLRDGLKAVATDLLLAAQADSQCKLLIVIDQFEELLNQTEPDERGQFAATLQPALGGPVQVLATLRPEFLDPLEKDPDLSKLALRIRQVRPLGSEALRSVIEEPAKVAGLAFDDDLVDCLVADTGTGDALPLLAYTLEQLADGLTRGGRLSRQRYVDIGGVRGALQRQADVALQEACSSTGATRDQVLSALLSLVTIDEQGRPTKRTVALDELFRPAAQLEPFITRRLLSTEADSERTLVAVSHEAFLVNWPPLKDEIDAQATALRARRVVENAARDWVASGRDVSALLQGRQLAKATVDTGAELQPVTVTDGRQAAERKRRVTLPTWRPRSGRLVTRVNLNDTGREFLEASMRADRSRRRRQMIRVASVMVVLALIAVTAVAFYFQANAERARAQQLARQATVSGLQNEAAAMLYRDRPGGDVRAMQELLAANAIDPATAGGGLLDAVLQRLTTAKIADAGVSVVNVVFKPDGRHLASAGGDTVRFWNAGSGQPLGPAVKPAIGATDRLLRLAVSLTGLHLASGGADNTVRLWNAETGQPLGAPLTGHTDVVISVAFSPDGHRVATGSADQTVRLWNADTGQPDGDPLAGHTGSVLTMAFSPDGHHLASGGNDMTVRLWNADTRQSEGVMTGHTGAVGSVAFSPDGHRLASGGADNTVRLWNADTGQPESAPLTGHTNWVQTVAFSPDGHRLASGGADNTVRLWNADTGQPYGAPLTGHTDWVQTVAFSPDGHRLASGSADKTVRLWSLGAVEPVKIGHAGDPLDVLSPDGHRLATGSPDGTVRLWNADTGRPVGIPLTGHSDQVNAAAFSPDGHRLATGGTDTAVRLWNADTGEPIGDPLTRHTAPVDAVAFSPDGHRLATGSADAAVWVWNADTGQPVGPPLRHSEAVRSVAFSPDGHRLATGSADGTVRLWNADTGRLLSGVLGGHDGDVRALAFSPDGHRLASGSADQTVRLWNADTGRHEGEPLKGHTYWVNTVAFSPDGQRVATGSADKTVRFWNADTGQPLGRPPSALSGAVQSLAFSPDGQRLISAGRDGTVWVWPAVATPQQLCDKLTTNMSSKQWRDWVSADPHITYRQLCPGLPAAN